MFLRHEMVFLDVALQIRSSLINCLIDLYRQISPTPALQDLACKAWKAFVSMKGTVFKSGERYS